MNAHRLSIIATEAVLAVFRFHDKNMSSLDEMYHEAIKEAVDRLWHLRARAQCVQVAHLEIAGDAAVTCAEVFNQRNPEQTINKRWVYNCVQNLLTAQLKPELLLDGAVDRLIELGKSAGDRLDDVDDEEDDDDDNDNDSSLTMSNRGDDDDDGLDDSSSFAMLTKKNMKMAAGGHAAPAVAKKEPKTPWTEDDVKLMVRLKDFDRLTHEEVAFRIGRGKGSVENKYGRVVKEDKWKRYAEACRKRSGRRGETISTTTTINKRQAHRDEEEDDDGGGDRDEGVGPSPKKQRC